MRKNRIVFTGGNGRFGKIFKKNKSNYEIFFPSSRTLDIEKVNKVEKYIKKIKPKYVIHCAALSRPMKLHDKKIEKSISTNIIGTSNIVKICSKYNIKLIYFSTNFVYPGKKGNYKENDPILPINNYGWSKLGGESAVHLYKNSLILRVCMTEKPFLHKKAFTDLKTNFMFHDELSKNLLKLIKYKGVINVGGKTQTVFNFAKKSNKKIKKISAKKIYGKNYPLNQSMNTGYYKRILNKK